MDNDQVSMTSGSVYADAWYSGSNSMLWSRTPVPGMKTSFKDGREFVVVSTAVDLTAGQLVATDTALATAIDNKCTAAAAGDVAVTISLAAIALFGAAAGVLPKDKLAGGYLITSDDAGEGYTYKIKGNTVSTAVTLTTTITLYDPLKDDLTTASDVILVGNRYDGVVVGTAALPPVGVVMVPSLAATNAHTEYLWVQTKGICGVLVGTAATIGKTAIAAAAGAATDGSNSIALPTIGVWCGTEATSTGKAPCLLNIGG